MPGLYGSGSNVTVVSTNTAGLYLAANSNTIISNVSPTNTMGLYSGNVSAYPSQASSLFSLLSNSGNVQFALTSGNTAVYAYSTVPIYGNSNVAVYLPTDPNFLLLSGQIGSLQSNASTQQVLINGLQSGLNTANSAISAEAYDIYNLQLSVAGLGTGLTSANASIAGLQSGLNTANTNITNLNSGLASTNSNVANLSTTVSGYSANITALQVGLASTNSNVANLTTTVNTYSANITALQVGLASTDANVASLSNTVATYSSNIAALQSGLTSTNSNVANLQTGLNTSNSYIASNAALITGLQTGLNTTNSYVSANASLISGLQTGLNTANSSITVLQGNIVTINSTEANLQTGLNSANTSIAGLQTGLNTANSYISSNATVLVGVVNGLNSANATIANVQTGLNSANTSIAGLQTGLNTANTTLSGLQTGLNTANTTISGVQTGLNSANTSISGLQSGLTTANTNITGLQNGLTTANTDISGLQTGLTTVNAYVSANAALISNLQTGLNTANSYIASNAALITGLQTGLNTTNVSLANTIANVTTLQGQVYANSNVAAYLPTYTGNLGGTLTTAAQPNITSVGTLTSVTTSGIAYVNDTTNATGVATGALQVLGGASFSKDVWIQGNLNVSNINSTTYNPLITNVPLVYLSATNPYPYNYDIGLYSHFVGGAGNIYQHTGIIRDYNTNDWVLFSNVASEPSGNVVNLADPYIKYDDLKLANLHAQGSVNGASGSITGNLTTGNVSGTYVTATNFVGNGALLTGLSLTAASGYYGAFSDSTTQTIASTTTAYPITFNTTDGANQVSVVSNSHITVALGGTYNLQWSGQFMNADNVIHTATVWLRKNGTDVTGSAGHIDIPGSHGGSNGELLSGWNYVLDLVAGDYVELVWSATSTQVSMPTLAAGTSPTRPSAASVIATLTQVTNVQVPNGNIYIVGDVSGSGILGSNVTTTLANVGTAGTYGDSTHFPIITTDAKGRITSVTTAVATNYSNSNVAAYLVPGAGIAISGGNISSTITQYTDALARQSLSFAAGSGAYNNTTGVITIPTNTNQLTNGSNYITLTSLSGGTGISYNNSTGQISSTITQYTDALARAAVSATGSLSYNSTTGVFSYTTPTTDGITEGTTNLYFTDARARAAVSGGTGISYSNTTGVISSTITQYTDAMARSALSFTAGSGGYNSTTGVITIPTNTNQLTNGANYITLTSLSAGTGMTYNNTTGVIATTITQYTDALARASLSAGTGISYNSTTGVIDSTITQYSNTNVASYLPTYTGVLTSGQHSVTYNPGSTTGSAIAVTGGNTQGGTGYLDFLKITNNSSGATNANKTFRTNTTGQIEIVNSAYSAIILSLTDAGALTVGGTTFPTSTGTNGQVLTVNGSGVASWQTPSSGSTYSNSNVSAYLASTPTQNITILGDITALGGPSVDGNISGYYHTGVGVEVYSNIISLGGYFIGDGSQLTGLSTYANSNVAAYMPTYTGNVGFGRLINTTSNANVLLGGTGQGGSTILDPQKTTGSIIRLGSVSGINSSTTIGDAGWGFQRWWSLASFEVTTGMVWSNQMAAGQAGADGGFACVNAANIAGLTASSGNLGYPWFEYAPLTVGSFQIMGDAMGGAGNITNGGYSAGWINGYNLYDSTFTGLKLNSSSTTFGTGGGATNLYGNGNYDLQIQNGQATPAYIRFPYGVSQKHIQLAHQVSSWVAIGNGTNTANISSNAATSLNITTNGFINAGSIQLVAGANGNINITPNGTGRTFIYGAVPRYNAKTTVTYAATITPDPNNGFIQTVTLTGNMTWNAFGGTPTAGQQMRMIVVQDATGSRTLTSTMKFAGGVKTLSTAANSIDIIDVFYDGTNYYANLTKGYA